MTEYLKNHKIIVLIGIACIALFLFFILKPKTVNPVADTKWENENGVILTFSKSLKYDWRVNDDNFKRGTYAVYTGDQAKEFISKYAKENKKDESFSAVSMREQVDKDGAFIIEENIEAVVLQGEKTKLPNTVYLVFIDNYKLTLIDIETKTEYIFMEEAHAAEAFAEQRAKEEESKEDMSVPEKIDDNLTSDKHLPFTYQIPEGYVKYTSEDDIVVYCANDFADSIGFAIYPDTILFGAISSYGEYEKDETKEYPAAWTINEKDNIYMYSFEYEGTSYVIDAPDKETIESIANSIVLKGE